MAKIDAVSDVVPGSSKTAAERASEAREAGNASYKKGKWAEAIGHYTTSNILNANDPAPLLNRAQAYLKLEKWQDAQRDCSTVLSLPSQSRNVKALFRRALARKEVGEKAAAISDLKLVLTIEPSNAAAKEELHDLEEIANKDGKKPSRKSTSSSASIPTPTPAAKAQTTSSGSATKNPTKPKPRTMTAIPIKVVPRFSDDTITNSSIMTSEAGPSTFIEKKAKREKKSFAVPAVPVASKSTAIPFISSTSSTPTVTNTTSILSPSKPPPPSSKSVATPPADADVIMRSTASSPVPSPVRSQPISRKSRSTARPPSSGMELFERLEGRKDDDDGWEILRTLDSSTLVRLIGNIIEPDHLATLVRVMNSALSKGEDETKEDVRKYMMTLRGMRRWTMTSLMLSEEEGRMADDVWDGCQ